MMQNMPLISHGFVWGTLQADNGMYTLASMDIFSGTGGGNLAADLAIDDFSASNVTQKYSIHSCSHAIYN